MSAPEIEALASPATSTPWVPLWPLGGQTLGELAYAENSGNTTLTGTNEASPHTVVTLPAITVDGATPIVLEFSAPDVTTPAVAQSIVVITLWDGAVDLGRIGYMLNTTGSQPIAAPVFCRRRLTPTAGSHTYSIRAFVSGGSGTVFGGPGGASTFLPVTFRALLAAPISNAPAGALIPVQYGTTLPSSPVDGQEAILVDSLTAPTYQWRFRWNAGSSSAYKWEFVGGSPAMNVIFPPGVIGSAGVWTNLNIDGPKITVPRAGDYAVEWAALAQNQNASGIVMYAGVGLGDTDALAYFGGLVYLINSLSGVAACSGIYQALATPASTVIKMRYFSSAVAGAQQSFQMRTIAVTPLRVA